MTSVLGAYGVSFSYGSERILNEVTLELSKGEIVALLGPNGSGKSTFLKIMAGFFSLNAKCCSGHVLFNGQEFSTFEAAYRARHVAYVAPDLRAEFPLTAQEAVMLGRVCHSSGLLRAAPTENSDQVQWAMEQCLCWGLRARDLHTLSGGERQLVALARALAQGAKILLLDEALSKMDLNHQGVMGNLLKTLASKGWSILLVSHDVNLATEWAHTCFLLKKGEGIAYGPVHEVLTLETIRKIYPGADLIVAPNPSTGVPKVFFASS